MGMMMCESRGNGRNNNLMKMHCLLGSNDVSTIVEIAA